MNPIGNISSPPGVVAYGDDLGAIPQFLENIFKTTIGIAGIWALFNFVLAGYAYLSSGNDPKKIQDATTKIWQTIIGLTIAGGAITISAILGRILFGDFNAFIDFRLFILS